jgi:hypothetical protein
LVLAGASGVAAAVSASCVPDYPPIAFQCDPTLSDACPERYLCCSDDPAAMDGTDVSGVLPRYGGRYSGTDTGVPIFSGQNNGLSRRGMCIEEGALQPGVNGLIDPGAAGCPVPCNPNWGSEDVGKVCGANTICCQTVEITINDCVLADDCWRPAIGDDIFSGVVQGLKFPLGMDPWGGGTHDTHQDPGGKQCTAFAAGAGSAALDACYTALGVADQRGFCLGISPQVVACPLKQQAYLDACEQLNLQDGRTGC